MASLSGALKLTTGAWRWWALAAVTWVLDQATKLWASAQLNYNQPLEITPFFNLTLRHNYGAAFSFLAEGAGWQRWFFTVIASVVSVGLVVWISRIGQLREKRLEACALALVLAGALGNLYDRISYGYVVDFLELHLAGYYWPAFNIADSAICVGAGLIILDMFLTQKNHHE